MYTFNVTFKLVLELTVLWNKYSLCYLNRAHEDKDAKYGTPCIYLHRPVLFTHLLSTWSFETVDLMAKTEKCSCKTYIRIKLLQSV